MPTWLQTVLAGVGFWLGCSVLNTWWRGYLRSRGVEDPKDPPTTAP